MVLLPSIDGEVGWLYSYTIRWSFGVSVCPGVGLVALEIIKGSYNPGNGIVLCRLLNRTG